MNDGQSEDLVDSAMNIENSVSDIQSNVSSIEEFLTDNLFDRENSEQYILFQIRDLLKQILERLTDY